MTAAGGRPPGAGAPATLVGARPPSVITVGPARVCFTGRAHGDMGHGGQPVDGVSPEVVARRRAVLDRPWTWLRQVHGDRVVTVRAPGDRAGEPADGAVSAVAGCALAVLTGDCAPVALASLEGVIGVAHAGWRGMVRGVVERTVEAMRGLGATSVDAVVGPCIGPECYEFQPVDLDRVAAVLDDDVRAVTTDGRPALDLRAAARTVLGRSGVDGVAFFGACTACSHEFYSWRARAERERQATVLWR